MNYYEYYEKSAPLVPEVLEVNDEGAKQPTSILCFALGQGGFRMVDDTMGWGWVFKKTDIGWLLEFSNEP